MEKFSGDSSMDKTILNILDVQTSQLANILESKNSNSLDTYVETLETSLLDELIANAILRFLLLETQGEQHHEKAVFEENYDFAENQCQLEESYRRAIDTAEKIIHICENSEFAGYRPESLSQLKKLTHRFRRILEDDESFYESEYYKELSERANQEIQLGNLEDWP